MNTLYVVIKINFGGQFIVDCITESPYKAKAKVEELKANPMIAHALAYEVPFLEGME